eukprot:1602183-Amphidinium_carterae.1
MMMVCSRSNAQEDAHLAHDPLSDLHSKTDLKVDHHKEGIGHKRGHCDDGLCSGKRSSLISQVTNLSAPIKCVGVP